MGPRKLKTWILFCVCCCAVLISGCATGRPNPSFPFAKKADAALVVAAAKSQTKPAKPSFAQVAFQDDESGAHAVSRIPDVVEPVEPPGTSSSPTFAPTGPVTLEAMDCFLLANHPEILKARSKIGELEGKQLQTTLQPNPRVGLTSEDINADDGAGRYGVFFGRRVVRGNKLELSSAVVEAELEIARAEHAAIVQRIRIELRQRYYRLLIANEKVQLATELVDIAEKSAAASNELFTAQEIAKAQVLRSELELENARLLQQRTINDGLKARRRLASLLGESELPLDSLAGDIEDLRPMVDFETAFDNLLASHPELSAALADVERSRRNLARQIVTPIPDVTWQTSVVYDFTTDEVVGGFQVGIPFPSRDRNEGAIRQAASAIESAEHSVDQKAQELRDQLIGSWSAFQDARLQAETYDKKIIKKSTEALKLVTRGYKEGETSFSELLLAQKFFAQTKIDYLAQLEQMWLRRLEIEGLLSHFSRHTPDALPLEF